MGLDASFSPTGKPFNWKGIDLNLLVSFQALYQTQSVSLAAERCHVSQSAMSHTLQRMRTQFDDPLFERVGIKMVATPRANEIAPVVDQLLQTIHRDLLAKPKFEPAEYKGVWRIGLTDYAEQLFAAPLYDQIKRYSPNAQVSFINVNRSNYQALTESEEIDVIVGSIANLDNQFLKKNLYSEQHLCLFDPQMVNLKHPVELEEFSRVEHALVSPDGRLETQVDKLLAKKGFARRVGVASRNFLTIRRLLIGRKLLCIVPKRFAQSEMDNHDLKALPAPIEVPDFDIDLVYRKAFRADEKNLWLRELVSQVIK